MALNILRRASFILLAPVYLFLVVLLQLTPAEGTMVAALSGLGVGIQGVFLATLYRRKKTKKIKNASLAVAKLIGYTLVTLILMLLGMYFLVYQYSLIIGLTFNTLGICAAIITIVKIEKLLHQLHS